jgi:hypothetical protein
MGNRASNGTAPLTTNGLKATGPVTENPREPGHPPPRGSVVLVVPKVNPPPDSACTVVLSTDSGLKAKPPPEPPFAANQTRPCWPHDRDIPIGDLTGWDASALSMTNCRPFGTRGEPAAEGVLVPRPAGARLVTRAVGPATLASVACAVAAGATAGTAELRAGLTPTRNVPTNTANTAAAAVAALLDPGTQAVCVPLIVLFDQLRELHVRITTCPPCRTTSGNKVAPEPKIGSH